MQFASPYFLWLLAVIPLVVVYYVWRTRQGGASIQVSTIDGVAEAPRTVRYYLRHLPFALRCAAVALLIVALARPQSVDEGSTSNTEGIDIVLAIDISTSMLAQDLQPDRIQAAKQVAGNFITDRPGDRIGLVAFAGEAFTQSPLTTDQGTLQTLLGRLRSGVVEDGTAIGNGLATAINRLRESNAKSKVIILLTDGENNRGEIAPLTAAEIARDQGIRVYTIGVGTRGTAPIRRWISSGTRPSCRPRCRSTKRYSARSPISRAAVTSAPRTTPNYSPSTTKSTSSKRARSKYRNTPPTPRSTSAGQRRLWPCCSWNFCCVPSG